MESKTVELRICLAILIFVLPVRSAIMSETRQAPAAGFQSMGKVTGTVMDTSGAVIVLPKPTIILEGRNSIKRVIPNDNGDYETTVPTGVYRITTEIPGFYPLRRAEFRVPPDATVIVNLVPRLVTSCGVRRYRPQNQLISRWRHQNTMNFTFRTRHLASSYSFKESESLRETSSMKEQY